MSKHNISAFERVKIAGFDSLYERIQKAMSFYKTDPDVCCDRFRVALEHALSNAFDIAGITYNGPIMAGLMIDFLKKRMPTELLNKTSLAALNHLNECSRVFHHDANDSVIEQREMISPTASCKSYMSHVCAWLIFFKDNCPEYIKLHGPFEEKKDAKNSNITASQDTPPVGSPFPNAVLSFIQRQTEYREEVQKCVIPDYSYMIESDIKWMDTNLPLIQSGALKIKDLTPERKDDVFFVILGHPFRRVYTTMVKYGPLHSRLLTSMEKSLSGLYKNTPLLDAETIFFSIKQIVNQENSEIDTILNRVGVPPSLFSSLSAAMKRKAPDIFKILLIEYEKELDLTIRGLSFLSLVSHGLDAIPGVSDEDSDVLFEMISDSWDNLHFNGDLDNLLIKKDEKVFRIDELKKAFFRFMRHPNDFEACLAYEKLLFGIFEFMYRYNLLPLGRYEKEVFNGFFENPLIDDYRDILISDDDLLEYPEVAERIISLCPKQ